jgi:hypothetical protein
VTRLIIVLAVVVSVLPAQQIQPGSCVAFNDAPTATPAPISLCNSTGSVSFVSATTFTATQLEVYAQATQGIHVTVTDSASGFSGTGSALPAAQSPIRWLTVPITPIGVSAGSTCTVVMTPFILVPGGANPLAVYANQAGSTLLTLTRTCAASQPCNLALPCQPPPIMVPLMLRLRGPGCSGGSPATINSVGSPCGSTGPQLQAPAFPMVGDPGFLLSLASAPSGGFTGLFLAEGFAAPATPVEPGHPCATRLQAASFEYLSSLGYEPLQSTVVSPLGTAGFSVPIPPLPELIGLHVTLQAAITSPLGIPLASVPGLSLMVTNALELQIGG